MVAKSTPIEKPIRKDRAETSELNGLALTLMQNTGTATYIVQNGKFLYVNSLFQKLTGYKEEELVGVHPLSFVHPDDRDMVRNNAIKSIKVEHSSPYEYRLIKKNSDIMWGMRGLLLLNIGGSGL